MGKLRVKDLINVVGGNTKIIIYNIATNNYVELYRGTVDSIDLGEVKYSENQVKHLTVVNGEDYLQIHISL